MSLFRFDFFFGCHECRVIQLIEPWFKEISKHKEISSCGVTRELQRVVRQKSSLIRNVERSRILFGYRVLSAIKKDAVEHFRSVIIKKKIKFVF